MDKEQIVHDLAITYAKSKLNEYVLDRREQGCKDLLRCKCQK